MNMTLNELDTPALLLDLNKLENNIARMHRHVKKLGVKMRPHGKTTKSIQVVQREIDGQFGGITVSTLKEAEYFFENGIKDMIYAVGIAPAKLKRIAALNQKGAEVSLIMDSMEMARLVEQKARELGCRFQVLIEVDSDNHRAGVQPESPALLELGGFLHQSRELDLAGVLTHAGGSYGCRTTECIARMSKQERDAAVLCAKRLNQAGLPCPIVSVGSTPTVTFAQDMTGVTEVRTGVFCTQDLVMAGLGVCRVEDIALSVLTTIIGWQKEKGWIITDAGFMAMSRDRGTANHPVDQGFGLACDLAGNPLDGMIISDTNQEHGIITQRENEPIDWEQFPLGGMLRILPNHACATAGMFEGMHVLTPGGMVVDYWELCRGW
jgi:D-serine deaminase-like pyridoxal phosphate-dependent protein